MHLLKDIRMHLLDTQVNFQQAYLVGGLVVENSILNFDIIRGSLSSPICLSGQVPGTFHLAFHVAVKVFKINSVIETVLFFILLSFYIHISYNQ